MGLETKATDVHWYLELFENLGITVWIDGGWGVDALLEKQTRPHSDLDIVIQQVDVSVLRRALVHSGHVDVPRDDTSTWNFVMEEPGARQLDIHVVVLDNSGNGIYGPSPGGTLIPAEAFKGHGTIGGRAVRCMTAEFLVESHTGYELDSKDLADLIALRDRFGLALDPMQEDYLRRAEGQADT